MHESTNTYIKNHTAIPHTMVPEDLPFGPAQTRGGKAQFTFLEDTVIAEKVSRHSYDDELLWVWLGTASGATRVWRKLSVGVDALPQPFGSRWCCAQEPF